MSKLQPKGASKLHEMKSWHLSMNARQKTVPKLHDTEKYPCAVIDANMTSLQQCAMRNMTGTIAVNFLLTSPQ
jgi:hypothetical protein